MQVHCQKLTMIVLLLHLPNVTPVSSEHSAAETTVLSIVKQ